MKSQQIHFGKLLGLGSIIILLLGTLFLFGFPNSNNNHYSNPILTGFYPDPSICRVGDNYYMVNSSFAYFPGIPIFHSTDLVHWRQIGHVLDRAEQLLTEGLDISEGIFAPAIRYHEGTFYVVCTVVGGGGNFVVTTTDPEQGWSAPVWLPEVVGIDPSLFFDDNGKAYIVFNSGPPDEVSLYEGHRAIWQYAFDKDSLQVFGERKLLVNGGVDLSKNPIWIEAPHILKKDGFYYLMCAEGGTAENHSEVVFRSTSAEGPYVPYAQNPILTQRHLDPYRPNPITSSGHADLVQTKNGEWWAVFLACRPYEPYTENHYNTGRETFMAPVNWTNDGWPIINPNNQNILYSFPAPLLNHNNISEFPLNGNFTLTDSFLCEKLPPYWVFVRTPLEKWYKLSKPENNLCIALRSQTLSGRSNPSFIARRLQHSNFSASTELNFKPTFDNEFAGIAIFQGSKNYYAFGVTCIDGKRRIVLLKPNDGKKEYPVLNKNGADEMLILATIPYDEKMNSDSIQLKMEGKGKNLAFSYTYNNKNWQLLSENIDATYLSTRSAGGFVGVTLGMYATSHGAKSHATAVYNWFEYSGNDITSIIP